MGAPNAAVVHRELLECVVWFKSLTMRRRHRSSAPWAMVRRSSGVRSATARLDCASLSDAEAENKRRNSGEGMAPAKAPFACASRIRSNDGIGVRRPRPTLHGRELGDLGHWILPRDPKTCINLFPRPLSGCAGNARLGCRIRLWDCRTRRHGLHARAGLENPDVRPASVVSAGCSRVGDGRISFPSRRETTQRSGSAGREARPTRTDFRRTRAHSIRVRGTASGAGCSAGAAGRGDDGVARHRGRRCEPP